MANKLLDEMGLDKKDAQGFRLKPDGKRASFVAEVPNDRLGMIDNFNMMKGWTIRLVGIEFVTKAQASALWTQRMTGSLIQLVGWPMGKPASEPDLVPLQRQREVGAAVGHLSIHRTASRVKSRPPISRNCRTGGRACSRQSTRRNSSSSMTRS